MKSTFTLLLAALCLGATGCHVFSRSKKPKPDPAIAADVEASFHQRWIERRTAELAAKGAAAEAARQQAEKEFREKYPFLLLKTGK